MKKETLKSYLNLAQSTARIAGDFLNNQKKEKKIVHSESGKDIKLEIDRAAEKLIREKLSVSGIAVYGEEFGLGESSVNSQGEKRWIVDPLDGTSNYFRSIDQSCVCIALEWQSEILIGVIYNFNTNQMYSSAKGQGAHLNGIKINVSNIKEKSKASLTTGFPASTSVEHSLKSLINLGEWKKIRMFGSAGLSCAYVAAGNCDCYIETGVYIWDIAAGICIIEEAGGIADYRKIDDETYSVYFSNGKI